MSERPSSRRLAREMAFQALYTLEASGLSGEDALQEVLERLPLGKRAEEFCRILVLGVAEERDSLDFTISGFLKSSWGIDRLALTDLSALRLATFELYNLPGMPPKVSISQAVELASRFGSKDSGRFVNGVLGNLLNSSPKAVWDPADEEAMEEDEPDLPTDLDVEIEEVEVKEGTAEADEFEKLGKWVVKLDGATP